MKDSELTFEEWWKEFHGGSRGRDYEEDLVRLLDYVSGLPGAKREAFVEGLVDVGWLRHGSSLALGALERVAGPAARRRVAHAVESLPTVHPPHPLGDYRCHLLRVLAADVSGEFLQPVDDYCQDEIGPGFTSVVWALWPHHERRFAQYHARYLAEQPWDAWGQTLVNHASRLPVPAAAAAGNANGRTQQTPQATAPAAVVRAATDAVRSGRVSPGTILLDVTINESVV